MKRLLNASLLVEGKPCVDLCGDLARHDLEDLTAELHKEVVKGSVNLGVKVIALVLAVGYGIVNELGVLLLLRRGEDEGRVGGGVLWLVLVDGSEVTAVTDNDLCELSVLSHTNSRRRPLRIVASVGLESNVRCQRPSVSRES